MHQAGEIVSRAQNAEGNSEGTQTTFETCRQSFFSFLDALAPALARFWI